jgi:hypothetical protein
VRCPWNSSLEFLGVAVFLVSDRAMARRPSLPTEDAGPAARVSMNMLAWGLLLLFVIFFLAVVWFVTGGD